MNKIGWCRLLIVISVFYAAIMGMYFGKNYPTDENLKNSIKLNYEAEKKSSWKTGI